MLARECAGRRCAGWSAHEDQFTNHQQSLHEPGARHSPSSPRTKKTKPEVGEDSQSSKVKAHAKDSHVTTHETTEHAISPNLAHARQHAPLVSSRAIDLP
eukprot:1190087-Prymnesium_polylepis.1